MNVKKPAFIMMGIFVLAFVPLSVFAQRVTIANQQNSYISAARRAHFDGAGKSVVFESTLLYTARGRANKKGIYIFNQGEKAASQVGVSMSNFILGEPVLSGNGRAIAYQAYTKNVNPRLPPAKADIMVYDRELKTHTMVTLGLGGQDHNGECSGPSFDNSGRKLAFTCNATNMHPWATTPLSQVYFKDLDHDELHLISATAAGHAGNRMSGDARLTSDGEWIFFKSASTNLNASLALNSLSFHLYMVNRATRGLIWIDQPGKGGDLSGSVLGTYDISENGDFVVFEGRVVDEDDPMATLEASNIYLYERATGNIRRLSHGEFENKAHDPAISGDGRFVAFVHRGVGMSRHERRLMLLDNATNEIRELAKGMCYNPVFSANGSFIAYELLRQTSANRPDAMDLMLIPMPHEQ